MPGLPPDAVRGGHSPRGSRILQAAEDLWTGRSPVTSILELAGHEAEEIAEGVLMIPGFSHAFALRHADGIVLFDSGSAPLAQRLYEAVRRWSDAPVTHVVFSHGHIDHVFGVEPFDVEARRRGWPPPVVVAHEAVARRFDRYRRTAGYNTVINQRQFGSTDLEWPQDYRYPDVTFAERYELSVGGLVLELSHHRGETDDHCVGWLPDRSILLPGDLFLWVSPNAGNPQKVQRYPAEWAVALRWMATLGAEVMLSSHGAPIVGVDRVGSALSNTALYLETIVEQTTACINGGATLLETVHGVSVPEGLLDLPYLRPLYDEPEFVVRNVWRQLAGWYDGDPAHLKPAPAADLATEIAAMCGGPGALAARARELSREGSHRLASHLVQIAVHAAPNSSDVHSARAEVFSRRASTETSTMARGVFDWARAESQAALSGRTVAQELGRSVLARGDRSSEPGEADAGPSVARS